MDVRKKVLELAKRFNRRAEGDLPFLSHQEELHCQAQSLRRRFLLLHAVSPCVSCKVSRQNYAQMPDTVRLPQSGANQLFIGL